MGEAARKVEPVTLERFDAMDFGDRRVELIGGEIVAAQAFPTSRHGRVTIRLGAALETAIDRAGLDCATESGTGIDVRMDVDFRLGPDLMVRCAAEDPVLVAEVLSPSNSASEMNQKLRAYQSVGTIADILILEQDRAYVEHWTRGDDGVWRAPERLSGLDAVIRLPRLAAEIPLEAIYRKLL